ncbi:methyltransferase-like protein 24 isoform X1 [Daphnia magna]|uniref:methyltransferase-like protein 24 isoform X1 n=2 Tax=Daphnia magna TaxID=35525 RepID=UPI001E1BB65A|nr:methyltransferase-like protein 24 isoform X1 [Daphnia magna]XP_045036632.1 methyltransferase-like protein 24 isoform X1 [Daphnia magna]
MARMCFTCKRITKKRIVCITFSLLMSCIVCIILAFSLKIIYVHFTQQHVKISSKFTATTLLPCKVNDLLQDPLTDWDLLLDAESLTGSQVMQYFTWTNHSSCLLTHDFGGEIRKNPTGIAGQKAVCIDPNVAPQPNQCLVYSFGIDNEWSFDEYMEQYGCEVFAFDPSMNVESHDHSPRIHFYNWGLSNQDEHNVFENWTMRSLSSIYESLVIHHGHSIIDYLKIDIEFYEWIALPQILKSGMLSKVRQMGIEVHLDHRDNIEKYREWAKILRSLENGGMIRFDSKHNPWSVGNFTEIGLWGSFGHEIAWYNGKLSQS